MGSSDEFVVVISQVLLMDPLSSLNKMFEDHVFQKGLAIFLATPYPI